MKQSFTFLLLFVAGVTMFAQYGRNLVLISGNQEPMRVIINEKPINHRPLPELRITGLNENYYDIKILYSRLRHTITARLYVPPLSEIVYEVYPPDRRYPRGEFYIKEIYPLDNQIPYYQPAQIFAWNTAIVNNTGQPAENIQTGQINININNNSTANQNTGGTIVYVPDYQGQIGCTPPVTPERFENMMHAVEKQDFESGKLRVAKQIIKTNNCLTVNQLVEILRLFDFDANKLKLAKYAYHYIYDIENYYKVNNVFDFESNAKKLDQYIQKQD